MIRVSWTRLEVELLVPGARFIVLGMHEQRSDTCNVGSLSRAQQCSLEQRLAQPLSLLGSVDCKTSEEHHRDWMAGKPLADSTGYIGMFDGADREAVVARDTLLPAAHDIGLSAARFLVDQSVALQESIESFLAATKRVDVVGGIELLDGRERLVLRRHSSTLFSASSLASRGLLRTGRSRTSWNACHWASSSPNMRRSISASSAALMPASSRN